MHLIEGHIKNCVRSNLIPIQYATLFSDCAFIINEYEIRELIVCTKDYIKILVYIEKTVSLPNKLTALNKWFYLE